MNTMELAKLLKESMHLSSIKKAIVARQGLSKLIIELLKSGQEFRIPKVGTLYVKVVPARSIYDPRTGEMRELPERRKVKFKVARAIREIINE